MGTLNTDHNRVCWVDIPVIDLDRAIPFYAAVLKVAVTKEKLDDCDFAVLEHEEGNGGCLVIAPELVSEAGALLYFNVHGRIRDATKQVADHGGKILEDVHAIGPHGFRSVVLDCEGNRCALHSEVDA